MNLPPTLIRIINGGRCLALIGSGPSCEMGYPSWNKLAEVISAKLISDGVAKDPEAYQECLRKHQYAELFRQAEFDSGGRGKLVEMLRALLVPGQQGPGRTYDILARWPFACYLTTNYDNEIQKHLDRLGVHFGTLQNQLVDFHHIRDGAAGVILKLHSDLDHPAEAIITSKDYKRLSTDTGGAYFQAKLRTIFDMFDVVIVGHSLTDPDIQLVLQTAQETANPGRPIYMIATGLNTIQVRNFSETYNVVVVRYDNPDGSHDQLRKLLGAADGFVTSRKDRLDLPPPIDAQESEAAVSMFVFRRLRAVRGDRNWNTADYVGPLILRALTSVQSVASAEDLLAFKPFASMLSSSDRSALLDSIQITCQELTSRGLLSGGLPLRLTQEGSALALELKATRELEKSQAYGQFATTVHRLFPGLDEAGRDRAITLVEQCIVEAFRSRGLAIANSILGDQKAGPEDLSALFGAISRAVAHLDTPELQLAFTEAAHEFLVSPTLPQQNYLTALSQGFFLFHMLGYDATCTKIRQDLFRKTAWFCDSSIQIPLLAVGSHNHDYAKDLFARLRAAGVKPMVTRRMCRETWEHLEWARRFIREAGSVTPEFLAAALVKPGFQQNLFLDGFIRLSAEGRISGFEDYLRACDLQLSHESVLKRLMENGLVVTDISLLDGFEQQDWGQVQELADIIKADRAAHSIYRSDDQVYADAEVLYLIRQLRNGGYRIGSDVEKAYFISQSNVFNRVSTKGYVTTWSPEAVYRYLLSLPGELPDPILLQECMLHEYYHAGISFIDKNRYLRFFSPLINASRVTFEEQKQGYLKDVESHFGANTLDAAFEATDDLEKPLFVHRLTLFSIEHARRLSRQAIDRAEQAEKRVRILESEREGKWRSASRARSRQLAAEERNLADPKHARKRHRQQKRRRKDGKNK